jgi:hypothetical protein
MVCRPHTPHDSAAATGGSVITSDLVLGIGIVLVGVLLMLDNLGVLEASYALRFLPLGLIAAGVMLLVKGHDSNTRFWGYAWIFVGSWLSLNLLNISRVGFFDLLWPLLIVSFGVHLIRKRGRRVRPLRVSQAAGSNLFALMSESKRRVDDKPFLGAQMTSIVGNCVLDLRQASIEKGQEATVEVLAVVGGAEILVPQDWVVISNVAPIAGSVEDKRLPPISGPSAPPPGAPRLVLRGTLVLGSLQIKD